MSSKKDKLMDILLKIQELYPNLDRIVFTDLDDPRCISITTDEYLTEMAEANGLDPQFVDDLDEYMEDDDDDEGNDEGLLH